MGCILGLVTVWVNGKQVAKQWRFDVREPVSFSIGKSIASFSGLPGGSCFQLLLNNNPLYPKYIGEQFTLPRSRAWIGRIAEILFFSTLLVLLNILPFSPSDVGNLVMQSLLFLLVFRKLAEVIRILVSPPIFDPDGLYYWGRSISGSEVKRVGLDTMGTLVIEGDGDKLVIPSWLSRDTPALARWVSEKTGLTVSSVIPVTLAWAWKYAPIIIGLLGFIAVLGLLWIPWWVIGSGLAIGVILGLFDLDIIIKGPLRGCYTFSGIVTFMVPIFLPSYWVYWDVAAGILFALLSAILGFIFAIRTLPNFQAALHKHGVSL